MGAARGHVSGKCMHTTDNSLCLCRSMIQWIIDKWDIYVFWPIWRGLCATYFRRFGAHTASNFITRGRHYHFIANSENDNVIIRRWDLRLPTVTKFRYAPEKPHKNIADKIRVCRTKRPYNSPYHKIDTLGWKSLCPFSLDHLSSLWSPSFRRFCGNISRARARLLYYT